MSAKNQLYWAYNLPLQVWPKHQDSDDENSPIVGARVLNYMPRKERCEDCDLGDLLGEQTREEFFESAALAGLRKAYPRVPSPRSGFWAPTTDSYSARDEADAAAAQMEA